MNNHTLPQPHGATNGGDDVSVSQPRTEGWEPAGATRQAPTHGISFFVPGEPTAKGRPRFVRATGRTYTPAKTIAAERSIAQFAAEAMRGYALYDEPLSLTIECGFLWPKSASKKRRELGAWKETRPDFDNLIKAISDSLNQVVWTDDGRVASVKMRKYYTDKPGTAIGIHPLCRGE